MNKQTFFEKLDIYIKENIGAKLEEKQKEQMFFLADKLIETNKVMNLTAIVDEDGIILRHIVDSLLISELIPLGASLIDVGCGAGFPTLPLAIFRSDIKITALDSTEKRVRYVEGVARELGLSNVSAVSARAEELAKLPEYRERFDFATARAVASLPVLCELTLPFVKVGGILLSMKAKDAEAELSSSRRAIELLAGKDAFQSAEIKLSHLTGASTTEQRAVVIIKKSAATPNAYPRKFGQIKKSPL